MDIYKQLKTALNSLAELPAGYAAALPSHFVERQYSAGSYFIRAGETAQGVGFIVQGLFKYFYIDYNGTVRIKTIAEENDFVVSYESLLTAEKSAYFIEALEPSTVLFIDRETYLHNVENNPYWAAIARKYVERLFIEKIRREASLLLEDAATRYESFTARHQALHNRLRLKDIASYLGMSDVTLSRIRHDRSLHR